MPQIRALLVNEVDELELCAAANRRDTAHLPHRLLDVPLSESDSEKSAILSWRWDLDQDEPSRNLRCAVRVARYLQKEFLFVDVVSIKQDQQKHDLIDAVVAFSKLYTQTLVIAAYERYDEQHMSRTMLRPWIFHECLLSSHSRFGIINASHLVWTRAEAISHEIVSSTSLRSRIENRAQLHHDNLDLALAQGFVVALIHLVIGNTQMADIDDLCHLLPHHSKQLLKARFEMGDNDYLLIAVLLSQRSPTSLTGLTDEDLQRLMDKPYERFSWRDLEANGLGRLRSSLFYMDTHVASLSFGEWGYTLTQWQEAIPAIFTSLGYDELVQTHDLHSLREMSTNPRSSIHLGIVWTDLTQAAKAGKVCIWSPHRKESKAITRQNYARHKLHRVTQPELLARDHDPADSSNDSCLILVQDKRYQGPAICEVPRFLSPRCSLISNLRSRSRWTPEFPLV